MFLSSTSTGDLQRSGVKNKANGQRPPTQLTSFVIFTLLGYWGISEPTISAKREKFSLQRTQDALVIGFLSARNKQI